MGENLAVETGVGGGATMKVDAIRDAFSGSFEAVPLRPGYRIGLVLVALATVLLPLIYLALIAATGYLIYLHATMNMLLLEGSGSALVKFIIYFGPIIVGVLLVLFMIKPLFAKPAKRPAPITLDSTSSPCLFVFVDQIRRAVRAPAPKEIHVDCDVNASAGLRHGLASLGRDDLVLTIGLPLIAGMTARQLAGVLAHEFGHFAQGSGMTLTYLVRSVNAWFARVVYERDEWDEKLARASTELDLRIGIILLLARFFIWVTRGLLWVLMILGHVIGTFMLRHMEFDADRYEARLSGSDAFKGTAMRLRVLSVASQKAMASLSESWADRRLVDDYPSFIAASANMLPEDLLKRIEESDSVSSKSVFDTHPSDEERIASAKAENAPRIFHVDVPARALVDDYETLTRTATTAFYQDEQEIDLARADLVSLKKYVAEQTARDEADKVADEYLYGLGSLLWPLPLPMQPPDAPASFEDTRAAVNKARETAAELANQLPKAEPEQGAGMREASVPEPALREAIEKAVAARLASGLSLLLAEETARYLVDIDMLRAEVAPLYRVLVELGEEGERVRGLVEELRTTIEHLEAHQRDTDDRTAFETLTTSLMTLHNAGNELLDALGDVAYPFEHAAGAVSVQQFASEDLPAPGEVHEGAMAGTQMILERLFLLYQRTLARLTVIAQVAEDTSLLIKRIDAEAAATDREPG